MSFFVAQAYSLPIELVEHVDAIFHATEFPPSYYQVQTRTSVPAVRLYNGFEDSTSEEVSFSEEMVQRMKTQQLQFAQSLSQDSDSNRIARSFRENKKAIPEVVPRRQHRLRSANTTITSRSSRNQLEEMRRRMDGTSTTTYDLGFVSPSLINSLYTIPSNVGSAGVSQAVYASLGQSVSPADLEKFQSNFDIPNNPLYADRGTPPL